MRQPHGGRLAVQIRQPRQPHRRIVQRKRQNTMGERAAQHVQRSPQQAAQHIHRRLQPREPVETVE